MREFVLIDLYTQMPGLPRFMREWSRDDMLNWLRLYGEVTESNRNHLLSPPDMFADTYHCRSWCGTQCGFVLREHGEMFVPGTRIRAWEATEPV
ncbi:MAG TPA: hypothetical protein VF725_07455 [Ktedonobacterales bacterium]